MQVLIFFPTATTFSDYLSTIMNEEECSKTFCHSGTPMCFRVCFGTSIKKKKKKFKLFFVGYVIT